MINLRSETAKRRMLKAVDRMMKSFERTFSIKLARAMKKQYIAAADIIEAGSMNYDHALQTTVHLLENIFKAYYKRIYRYFGKIIFEEIKEKQKSYMVYEKKGVLEDQFYQNMAWWAKSHMGELITKMHKTTKKKIAKIVEDAMFEGKSNREIAKKIREVAVVTVPRAAMIARTETHTTAVMSTNYAMDSTRLKYTKEWVSAMDSRTRTDPFSHVAANGETVPKDGYYTRTSESLRFPGDPNGSAANVINCRCIEIYNTIRE